MGWEVGGSFKREGTYVYLWLIHDDVWQKPIQHCEAMISQLKINKFLKYDALVTVFLLIQQMLCSELNMGD